MMYNKEHAMMNVHLVNVKMGVGRANNVNVRTIEASRGIVIQGQPSLLVYHYTRTFYCLF